MGTPDQPTRPWRDRASCSGPTLCDSLRSAPSGAGLRPSRRIGGALTVRHKVLHSVGAIAYTCSSNTYTMNLRTYVIRIGDGNDGTFPRATCKAPDAFEALRIGTRHFGKPWDVRHNDAEGDDDNASLASYRAMYSDGACRWVMDAQLIDDCCASIPSLDLTPKKYTL